MIFSVSNNGIHWTLDFGPDSVTIAVNYHDQNITISSQEIPLAAWQLLLSQRQDFLNNHLARVPITPNQEGTIKLREEVISSVGAQDLDTSSYQVSDREEIHFKWENSQLDMDAVFRSKRNAILYTQNRPSESVPHFHINDKSTNTPMHIMQPFN